MEHLRAGVVLCNGARGVDDCEYWLSYMPMRNRAEVIRLMLAYANVPYAFEVVGYERWNEVKPAMNFGKTPALVDVDGGGTDLTHETAMTRYLADKLNLSGSDSFQKARVDELFSQYWHTIRNNGLTHAGELYSAKALKDASAEDAENCGRFQETHPGQLAERRQTLAPGPARLRGDLRDERDAVSGRRCPDLRRLCAVRRLVRPRRGGRLRRIGRAVPPSSMRRVCESRGGHPDDRRVPPVADEDPAVREARVRVRSGTAQSRALDGGGGDDPTKRRVSILQSNPPVTQSPSRHPWRSRCPTTPGTPPPPPSLR